MTEKKTSTLPPSIAIISPNFLFGESLKHYIEKGKRYNCISQKLYERRPEEFPIEGIGLHIFGYHSQNNSRRPYIQKIILPITQSEQTRLLFIIPPTESDLEFAIKAGANGCVSSNDTLSELNKAIDSVFSGDTYSSPSLTQPLYQAIRKSRYEPDNLQTFDLTRREIEITNLINKGLTNKQIAKELHISTHTVKNHVHNIIEKLKVDNRTEAARQVYSLTSSQPEPTTPTTP